MAAAQPITPSISVFWMMPFIALLGSIAVFPLVRKHWWEKNYPYIALVLAAIASSYYFFGAGLMHRWLESMEEYTGFIVLLASLYIISGGVVITVTRKATPLVNLTFLLIGAIVANLFGTTGAAMLLIRPYLRMNRAHLKPYHVVFFIFIVANVGGCLTPIGDPPLFIGYLMGVPFGWVFENLHAIWMVAIGLLLLIFAIVDYRDFATIKREHQHDGGPRVQITGIHNFLFILLVTFAVFRPSAFELFHHPISFQSGANAVVSREILMIAAAVGSWLVTNRKIYAHNEFSFEPIREVAILFAAIFATMTPATQFLQANASHMPINHAGQIYFAGGALSSLLDNAPTYKTIVDTRLAEVDAASLATAHDELQQMATAKSLEVRADISDRHVRGAVEEMAQLHPQDVLAGNIADQKLRVAFLLGTPEWNILLVAISAASVLFGACTYIGNGPNLMVKSIADAAGVQTPSFATYLWKYAAPILLPIYIVIWIIFLR